MAEPHPVQETSPCAICGLSEGETWGIEYQGHRIVRCPTCALRWVSPRPSAQEVTDSYEEAWKGLQSRGRVDLGMWRTWVEDDLRTLAGLLECSPREQPRILDVGTGIGHFPTMARVIGIDHAEGTDLSAVWRERLEHLGIPLHVGLLEDLEIGPYDVVTAQHVLEHLPDPRSFLVRCHDLLAPEGLLHLLLPNEGSLISRFKSGMSHLGLKRRAFKHLAPGHHLWFFEPRTLGALVESCGFEVLRLGTRPGRHARPLLARMGGAVLEALGMASTLELVARRRQA